MKSGVYIQLLRYHINKLQVCASWDLPWIIKSVWLSSHFMTTTPLLRKNQNADAGSEIHQYPSTTRVWQKSISNSLTKFLGELAIDFCYPLVALANRIKTKAEVTFCTRRWTTIIDVVIEEAWLWHVLHKTCRQSRFYILNRNGHEDTWVESRFACFEMRALADVLHTIISGFITSQLIFQLSIATAQISPNITYRQWSLSYQSFQILPDLKSFDNILPRSLDGLKPQSGT